MVNKVILVGSVGKDPEIKVFDNGGKLAIFSFATNERGFTTKDGKDIPQRTEWHNISVARGLATVAENYVRKGSNLYLEGKIRTRSWEDQNGDKKYMTEVHVDELQMLPSKRTQDDQPTHQPVQQQTVPPPSQSEYKDPGAPDDDLPF